MTNTGATWGCSKPHLHRFMMLLTGAEIKVDARAGESKLMVKRCSVYRENGKFRWACLALS